MHVRVAQRRFVFAVALSGVFLAAQLSSLTHQLLVKHVTCAEHGELIHADAAGTPAAPSSERAVSAGGGVKGHGGHEHCDLFFARREQLALPVSTVVPFDGWTVEPVAPAAHRVGFTAPVALLRLAPKASPPARG